MQITAALIPHNRFHTGIWLLAKGNPSWYYFKKKKNKNQIYNSFFYKTLDKPLRKLVRILHKNGIITTPSCSGHHISERDLLMIYKNLKKDEQLIRTEGLTFTDVETSTEYYYYSKNYRLPWSRKAFLETVAIYQQKGVLGLRLGSRRKIKDRICQMKIDGVTVEDMGSLVLILVNDGNAGNNKDVWAKITRQIAGILSTKKTRNSHDKQNELVSALPQRNTSVSGAPLEHRISFG